VITHEFSSEDEIQLDISTGPITRDEVNQSAISKKRQSSGNQWHTTRLIKAGGETTVTTICVTEFGIQR